jgi:hypothetical protein
MRGLLRRALLGLCFASPLAAQTSDPIFARWHWNPDSIGSRPAGLGGAFVAVADSNKASHANPAGLTLIPVRELGLSSGGFWLGGAAGGRRARVAAYLAETSDSRQTWNDTDAAAASGALEASVWEAGVAVGVLPLSRVRLGASLAWSRLSVAGSELRSSAGGSSQTTVNGEDSHARLAAGLLVDIVGTPQSLPSARLGISYQPGFDWTADIAHDDGTPAEATALRRPSLVAAGLAWRPSDHWSFSAQGDFIRYNEVVDAMRRNVGDGADGFRLPDTVEPRVGTEFAAPLWCGCGVVKRVTRGPMNGSRAPSRPRRGGPSSRSAPLSSPSTSATPCAWTWTRKMSSTAPPCRSGSSGGSEHAPAPPAQCHPGCLRAGARRDPRGDA